MSLAKYENYSSLVLRVGLGFVFIWFGFSGLTNPEMWTGLVPAWTGFIASAKTLVLIHGIVEIIGGFLLCTGFRIRLVSAILLLSLLHTLTLLSFGPVFVRDIGLAAALLAVFLKNE